MKEILHILTSIVKSNFQLPKSQEETGFITGFVTLGLTNLCEHFFLIKENQEEVLDMEKRQEFAITDK